MQTLNIYRLLVVVPIVALFLLAHHYWGMQLWHWAGRARASALRIPLRGLIALVFGVLAAGLLFNFLFPRRDVVWRYSGVVGVVGLWMTTVFWAWLAVHAVKAAAWLGRRALRLALFLPRAAEPDALPVAAEQPALVDFGRRGFLQTATFAAGALPFAVGGYGFVVGRRDYTIRTVELPIADLPQALDGLRIVQLSDIHIGSYMSASEVRRIVGMANELMADVVVVTGDYVTGVDDPLETCVAELADLRAPLGVWGCNGNHEAYAGAEAVTPLLFERYGMHVLRQHNVEIVRHGQPFNLIGVDYQRTFDADERPVPMLHGVEALIRPGMPNVLLSHNPNVFPRAAELGIDLTLAGHTHGGQVRVEILNHAVTPVRFFTPYVAGLYRRPLGTPAERPDQEAWRLAPDRPAASIYVNRGLGTIGVPVRLGVPPEISQITLCCA